MAKAKKRSSKKPARAKKAAKRAPAKKKAAAKPAGSGLEALAKKIVRMSTASNFGPEEVRELYNPDAVSVEASGQTATGYAALDAKMKGWSEMTSAMVSKPRNVWCGKNTICIEWDSTVTMRDGRTVPMHEVAVHEIKNGKIQSERYYYNPASLAPPQQSLPGV
jgi:ketosteroid isomerase-like protein